MRPYFRANWSGMSPFVTYLLAANAVAFLAYTIDYFLCGFFPKLDDTKANAIVMDLFPVAGGAVGTLLALFVWSGRLSEHRINKGNVAWWFLAFACLIVWSAITAVVTGLVHVSLGELLASWNLATLKMLGIYLAVINLVTLVVFITDKAAATNGNDPRKRMPEACLLGLCLAGGSVGGLISMYTTRHKTKKWHFVYGLPAFLALDAGLVVFAHSAGLI